MKAMKIMWNMVAAVLMGILFQILNKLDGFEMTVICGMAVIIFVILNTANEEKK